MTSRVPFGSFRDFCSLIGPTWFMVAMPYDSASGAICRVVPRRAQKIPTPVFFGIWWAVPWGLVTCLANSNKRNSYCLGASFMIAAPWKLRCRMGIGMEKSISERSAATANSNSETRCTRQHSLYLRPPQLSMGALVFRPLLLAAR